MDGASIGWLITHLPWVSAKLGSNGRLQKLPDFPKASVVDTSPST
jgi:hypothetical protein